MKNKSIVLTIVIFLSLFLLVNIGQAEPTPTVNYLMKTPVSLFDYGMYKLDKSFKESAEDNYKIDGKFPNISYVSYNFNLNKISMVLIYVVESKKPNIKDIKNRMGEIIGQIRGTLSLGNYGLLSQFFSHKGYTVKGKPDNIGKDLANIIELELSISFSKESPPNLFEPDLKCTAPLLDNGYFCLEK